MTMYFSRLSILLLGAFLMYAEALHPPGVAAQTDIFIRGAGRKIPIAMPQLCLQSGDFARSMNIPNGDPPRDIPKIMGRNLDLSGLFEIMDPGSYIETPGKCLRPDELVYSDWSVIGAEGLVRGVVTSDGTRVKVQMFLHDVQRQRVLLGKEYEGDITQTAAIAHRFSNEVYRMFTGEEGIFGTQIAYSSKIGRFRELFVMDMDGSNVRQLTNDRALAVTPSWDVSGQRLAFTSYRNRIPDIFLLNVNTRATQQVTRSVALELGPRFSADGNQLLASITDDGRSNLVLMNLDGTIARNITPRARVIDVSPVWSPDRRQIAFCSNRGGGPQIYTMALDGSAPKRISFVNSNYCTSPAWSPKGDRLAFVCRSDGGFNVFVSDIDGLNPLQLTSVGDNEDPDWAPNGRYIVFSTTLGRGFIKSIAMMKDDGSNIRRLTTARVGDVEPRWGPLPRREGAF
jgi:TolB protein